MKVIILAGGLGTRISEETENKPKPMVLIDDKPILWHLMNIFSSQGFDEFVLALGYRSDVIKRWLLDLNDLNGDIEIDTLEKKDAESKKAEVDELDDRNHNEQPKVISFTGGYSNTELIDDMGRVKPPSIFDRLQLSKLKEVVKSFGKRILAITEHQKKMEDVLNAVSLEYEHINSTVSSNEEGEGKRSSLYRNIDSSTDYYDDRNSDMDTRAYSRDFNSNNDDSNSAIKRPKSNRKLPPNTPKPFTPKVLPPTSRNPYLSITNDNNNEGNLLSALDDAILNR